MSKYPTTAVLWINPVRNKYNELSYDTPTEIKVRWENAVQQLVISSGESISIKSVIYTENSLSSNCFLYKGSLVDLSEDEKINPLLISSNNKGSVVYHSETPNLKGTKFINKVYL